MNDLKRRVRQMTKLERRGYLLDRGWTRIGDTWHHPTFDEHGRAGDCGFYSLAAVIRTALAEDTTAITEQGEQ